MGETLPAVLGRTTVMEGLEDFSPRDLGLQPAELRIKHKKQKRGEKGEPGQFFFTDAKDVYYDSVRVVLLKATKARIFYEGKFPKRRIVCASCTGLEPMAEIAAPKAPQCVDPSTHQPLCAYAEWTDNPEKPDKRLPPKCGGIIAFLGVRPDAGDAPFFFVCGGTAEQPAREFMGSAHKIPGFTKLRSAVITLTTLEKSREGSTYYIPTFTAEVDPSLDARYRALYEVARDVIWVPPLLTGGGEEKAGEEPKDVTPEDDGLVPF